MDKKDFSDPWKSRKSFRLFHSELIEEFREYMLPEEWTPAGGAYIMYLVPKELVGEALCHRMKL